ncbi:peptidase C14, caspase domain-containing protein [Lophiotrema nucula]|uniref:Peptidase C14, caspase domain-containing protein n=1 Tax=Lophiotrema nucula TaxID=690887 RepID=A0A6A5YVK0_9PLEO|nr:peptidase C14, caspase domain-containing protein [Lophiotrema nucula]
MRRKKSLLIGINYWGSKHQLQGCHADIDNIAEYLSYRGYANDHQSRVILSDMPGVPYTSPYFPTGRNILQAMDWLVSEPNCTLFMHYSGHGGQVEDEEGMSETGMNDTIVPVDFERNGQINSTLLHRHLVTNMAPGCTLFIILDCCHSGSALELPYVYRSSFDGQVNLLDNLKQGARLWAEARDVLDGDYGNAKHLMAGASSFFNGLKHMGKLREEGLDEGAYAYEYGSEKKLVTMLSGCRDDQTSADARIQGRSSGAMTWAFLQTMKRTPNPTYVQTLQMTRGFLDQSHYTQVPQLSTGVEMDLNRTGLIL